MMHIDFTWSSNLETSNNEVAMSELKMRIRIKFKMLQSRLTLDAILGSHSWMLLYLEIAMDVKWTLISSGEIVEILIAFYSSSGNKRNSNANSLR